MCLSALLVGGKRFLRVSNDTTNANGGCRARLGDLVAPEGHDEVQGRNLERNEEGLVKEEVPADHETQRIVDPVASETDETTRDRHVDGHFSNGVVDHAENQSVESIGQEQAARATSNET